MKKAGNVIPLPTPETLWQFELEYRGLALPVLSLQVDRLLFSCQQLAAIDQATGFLEWRYPLEVKSHVAHGRSVIGWVSDHEAHSIDGESGEPIRSIRCLAPHGQTLVVGKSLLVAGYTPGTYGWRLTCHDLVDDRCRWRHTIDPQARQFSMAASHAVVLLGLSNGVVRALALDTGTLLWERHWPDNGVEDDPRAAYLGKPTFHGSRAILQAGDRTVALDAAGGATVWESPTVGSSIVHDDKLIGFDRAGYWVLNAATGELVSRRDIRPLIPELDQQGTIVAVANGFAVLSMPGLIVGLEIETGTPVWSCRYKGLNAALLATEERFFVASDARHLMAFSTPKREG